MVKSVSTLPLMTTATPPAPAFVMADHPGIFARLAGALALVGANVVDARSYTTKDGWVTDAFWIQDADGNPYDVSRLPRLRQMISKTLKGEIPGPRCAEIARQGEKTRKVFRSRRISPLITTGRKSTRSSRSTPATVPACLYDLTRSLSESNVYIANAVIATYGEQVGRYLLCKGHVRPEIL